MGSGGATALGATAVLLWSGLALFTVGAKRLPIAAAARLVAGGAGLAAGRNR